MSVLRQSSKPHGGGVGGSVPGRQWPQNVQYDADTNSTLVYVVYIKHIHIKIETQQISILA